MRLMLLRHAKSEKGEPGMSDRDRGLNDRGRRDARQMGSYMAHHALRADHTIVSAARRTRETWDCLATAFAQPCPARFEERLYNAGSEEILNVVREAGAAVLSLLIIGHNPGMHKVAQQLIAAGEVEGRERLSEGMPTAALVVIDFAGGNWRELRSSVGCLERFVTPRMLRTAPD